MISSILLQKELKIYGKGKNSREWIYVLDHCKALYKVFKKGKIGENYNIGTNQNLKNIELAKKIIQISKNLNLFNKKNKIVFIKDRPGHDLRYALNSSKIKNKINWRYEVNIKEGLLKTFEWYIHNKNFFKAIKNKNFITRIGKLR